MDTATVVTFVVSSSLAFLDVLETQTPFFDVWGRLTKITERDNQNNGYNWSAVYDPFGRRLKTVYTPVTTGAPVTAKTQTVSSYYDPNVEFLEVGVKVNENPTSWKAYGPDKDGSYGGLNGIGGLEAIITPTKTYSIVSDALGHVVGTYDGTEAKRVATQVGSYGPLPGSLALPLSDERGPEQVTNWQGKRLDETGLIWIGDRYYDPANGTWISADPYGHFGSWSLHSFANGNPIVYCDPTGRIATGFHQGAIKGDYYEASNTAQGIGKFVGQVGVGFVPWVGQAADIRDLTAAWNVGRTHGWSFGASASLAMAGVAFIPGSGDLVRSAAQSNRCLGSRVRR